MIKLELVVSAKADFGADKIKTVGNGKGVGNLFSPVKVLYCGYYLIAFFGFALLEDDR